MHNKGAVLGRGRSRGGQSVATYVKGGATYAKVGGSTSRGRTRRGSVGSAGGALPNRTHLQCFGRYPVTSSLRSRSVLPRGKPQAESAGGSPPRPRGLGPGRRGSQSGPLGGEAAPAWKKGNYFSVGASQNKKKQSCSRYHDCLYWSKKEWDWAIPPTNPIEWDWAIPRKKAQ